MNAADQPGRISPFSGPKPHSGRMGPLGMMSPKPSVVKVSAEKQSSSRSVP